MLGRAHPCFVSFQPDTSLHCESTNTGPMHRIVCVDASNFAGAHCIPQRDGQAELIWDFTLQTAKFIYSHLKKFLVCYYYCKNC